MSRKAKEPSKEVAASTVKKTGVAELDKMIESINKQLSINLLSVEDYNIKGWLSSGSVALDSALGGQGFPKGRLMEILGPPSSGKTSLVLSVIGKEQRRRKARLEEFSERMSASPPIPLSEEESEERDYLMSLRDLIVDMEYSITTDFLRGFGIDPDLVLHVRVKTAEEALTVIRELPKTGKIGVVLVDSIGAMATADRMRKALNEVEMGGLAKLLHVASRDISKISEETQTTYFFINHITYKLGVMMGNPETSPGGQALPFYCAVRLKLNNSKPSETTPNSFIMRVKIIKTKVAVPFGKDTVDFIFNYATGIDEVADLLTMATSCGFLRHSAGQTKIRYNLNDEMAPVSPLMPPGKEAGIEWIATHADVFHRLRDAVLEHLQSDEATPEASE